MARKKFVRKRNVVWKPHPGSQVAFLTCPADEVLLHGNRGGGKTDCLLMDYLQSVGVGYGSDWRGIIFRQEYTQLIDVINKCNKWIPQIFPGAKYNGSEHRWTFPSGEMLYLRNMKRPEDYWGYHGWEIPFLGWEELTNWATDECYLRMMSTNRSSNPNVPRKIRSTCNPSGSGHGWVKSRFIDPVPPKTVFFDKETKKTRVNIPSKLEENTALLEADPNYVNTILAAVADDPVKYKAWVLGEWDIIAGGALTDVWDKDKQIFAPFEFPKSWHIYRSFDWGSAKPWAVTYGVESNGEQPDTEYDIPYIPAGSVIIIDEIYGWNGTVNEGDRATSQEIAERVLEKDRALEIEYGTKVYSGPADTSIYEVRDGTSIGSNLASHGCHWKRAYKGSGSRVAGLAIIRQMLAASKRGDLEKPGLYFFDRARHHIRTFPLLQYDEKKSEDVDTNQEDHAYDCLHGDTLIVTDKGIIPIKKLVGSSGKVLSVNNKFAYYYDCRMVHKESTLVRVHFEDKSFVDCTPNHEFLTTNGLVTAEDLLTLPDTYCIVNIPFIVQENIWNVSKLFQKLNKNFREKCTIFVESTFKEKAQDSILMVVDYIKKCTLPITGRYLKDFMYITMMGIKQIISQKTLNYCTAPYTAPSIKKNISVVCQKNVCRKPQNGMEVKKEKDGILNITKILRMPFMPRLVARALFVVKNTKHIIQNWKIHFAPVNANLLTGESQVLTILKEDVSYVPKHLRLTSTILEKHVVARAAQHCVLGVEKVSYLEDKQPTYCLSVKDTHTFALGNGVLSSNSTRYLLTRKFTKMKRRKVKY